MKPTIDATLLFAIITATTVLSIVIAAGIARIVKELSHLAEKVDYKQYREVTTAKYDVLTITTALHGLEDALRNLDPHDPAVTGAANVSVQWNDTRPKPRIRCANEFCRHVISSHRGGKCTVKDCACQGFIPPNNSQMYNR